MRKQTENTFVLSEASEIFEALVGLRDVRVLHYQRRGPEVALVIEQLAKDARRRACKLPAQVKDRPLRQFARLWRTHASHQEETPSVLCARGLRSEQLGVV